MSRENTDGGAPTPSVFSSRFSVAKGGFDRMYHVLPLAIQMVLQSTRVFRHLPAQATPRRGCEKTTQILPAWK